MKKSALLVVAALLACTSLAFADSTQHTFDLQAASIRGAASGEISLVGGGTFNPATDFVEGGGEFRSLRDVNQGPLNGLRAGEGVRWKALQLLTQSGFKCGSDPAEPLKQAFTTERTVVMKVGFFRLGDGATPSFVANVFVSLDDLDPGADGTQNVWVQQVGCGTATVGLR